LGQPTPTTETGFSDKTNPHGVKINPLNPIKLMLSLGASFVARVDADINQIMEVIRESLEHKGFAFIEVLQPCLIFHSHSKYKKRVYDLKKEGHDKTNLSAALLKADEFDYNSIEGRIPTGIFYQKEKPVFEELKLNGKNNLVP
jgi:2-oxoglutarate ferredoxin oxidoreductase subunit beta